MGCIGSVTKRLPTIFRVLQSNKLFAGKNGKKYRRYFLKSIPKNNLTPAAGVLEEQRGKFFAVEWGS